MISTITYAELGLAAAAALMVTWEMAQLAEARRQGLTSNVSRLVTHGTVLVVVGVYAVYTLYWWQQLEVMADAASAAQAPRDANWAIALLGTLLAVVMSYQIVAHLRAWRAGLTQNMSRLMALLAICLCLALALGLSVVKWDLYLEKLEATYERSIPSG